MANRIKMAMKQAILVLSEQGWSYRAISRRLGVHRETVSKHVRAAQTAAAPRSTNAPSAPSVPRSAGADSGR